MYTPKIVTGLSIFCAILIVVLPTQSFASTSTSNINITADTFEFDGEKNIVIAVGNVIMKQGDIRIHAKRARYNKTTKVFILFDDIILRRGTMKLTCKKIRAYETENRLEAIGNIRFSYQNIRGSAGRAIYSTTRNEVTLLENPKAWQNENAIAGDTIIINLEEEKIITRGNSEFIFSPEPAKGAPK